MLRAEHLQKRFGQRRVLSDVSMGIGESDCYTLFGANGSGKTTLAFLFASLLKPTRGTITYKTTNIQDLNARYRASVGVQTHSSLLYEQLSGYENLRFFGGLYGKKELSDRIAGLSSFFNMESRMDEPIKDLSRGLKQRLSIMRALIHDPPIIILDEPFTGLDEVSAKRLDALLKEEREAGKCILITTHNLSRGYRSATSLGILANGQIAFHSDPDSISLQDLQRTYDGLIKNETS